MRGKHRSFALADVVREAQLLELQGAREVNLVAQDLAHYGRDLRNGVGLPELLRGLLDETSIPWLRLLYLYSAGLTPKLISWRTNRCSPTCRCSTRRMLSRCDARASGDAANASANRDVVPTSRSAPRASGFSGRPRTTFSNCSTPEETRLDRRGSPAAQEGTRAVER
jgi:hypothetical protein